MARKTSRIKPEDTKRMDGYSFDGPYQRETKLFVRKQAFLIFLSSAKKAELVLHETLQGDVKREDNLKTSPQVRLAKIYSKCRPPPLTVNLA